MNEININDPKALRELYDRMNPIGSGPLGLMKIIRSLIRAIAEEKGIDLDAERAKPHE